MNTVVEIATLIAMKDIYQCKLLIVDDEPALLSMLKELLNQAGFSFLYPCQNCQQAWEVFRSVQPDAAILDVMLPDGDGFSLLTQLRSRSEIPVLFLSAKDEDEDRLLGLGLGADDYLTKPFLPRELTLRLTAILKRAYFPAILKQQAEETQFTLGDCHIDFQSGMITSPRGTFTLTAKEYILLKKLFQHQGTIVTFDRLCRAAWDDTLYGYENTLMVHIRRLREKIEPEPSHPRYLLTVRGLGYKLVTRP